MPPWEARQAQQVRLAQLAARLEARLEARVAAQLEVQLAAQLAVRLAARLAAQEAAWLARGRATEAQDAEVDNASAGGLFA